jgi:hypothetical protein
MSVDVGVDDDVDRLLELMEDDAGADPAPKSGLPVDEVE